MADTATQHQTEGTAPDPDGEAFRTAARLGLTLRFADLIRALERIAEWDDCDATFRADFGSNGERDHYRAVARKALDDYSAQSPAEGDATRRGLLPCPFCGRRPVLTVRPDNAEATSYFAAVACFCGGYAACAHKDATASEADEAERLAREKWNGRAAHPQPKGTEVPQGPRTEFVLNELRSALSAMTTFFGMDEDEASKPTFDKARQALNYAEIVMRPLEPWERQSLEDFRACAHRWHEKAVAKGYDGVEAMCDTALPYGTRDLRLVSPSPAPAHASKPNGFSFDPATEEVSLSYEDAQAPAVKDRP